MKSKVVSVRLSGEVYNKLAKIAKRRNRSISDIVREAVIQYCDKNCSKSIFDVLPKLAESVQKAIKESLGKEV